MTLDARHAILDALLTVLDEEHAIGLIDHRKAKKVPLTPLAVKILLKQLRMCPDPNEAVEEMINRGWTGIKAAWICKPQKTGRRNYIDAALDRINGPESVFGNRIDAERLSHGGGQPGSDDGNLRVSIAGAFPAIRH